MQMLQIEWLNLLQFSKSLLVESARNGIGITVVYKKLCMPSKTEKKCPIFYSSITWQKNFLSILHNKNLKSRTSI